MAFAFIKLGKRVGGDDIIKKNAPPNGGDLMLILEGKQNCSLYSSVRDQFYRIIMIKSIL